MDSGNRDAQPRILISVALLCFVAGALYSWSAMIPAIQQAFDVESQQSGMVFSLAIVTFTILALAAPRLPADFRGLRGSITASLIGAAALSIAAMAPNFLIFLAAYSLGFGAASGAVYIFGLEIAAQTKMPKLFTAFIVASFGFGGVVYGPVLRLLVATDWGLAALFIPAVSMVLVAAIAKFFPQKPGLIVRTEPGAAAMAPNLNLNQPGTSNIVIILLWFVMATGSAAGLMTLGLATTVIESQGGSVWLSSLALSGVAIGNTGGRLIVGVLPGRFPVGWLIPLASAGSVTGLLISLTALNPATTAAGIVLVAAGYGIIASTVPVLTQIMFGTRRFGRVYSIVFTAWGMAGLISPWLAGLLFDIYGNFSTAFILAAGASAFAFGISLKINRIIGKRSVSIDHNDTNSVKIAASDTPGQGN